jgi:hypothetical protein
MKGRKTTKHETKQGPSKLTLALGAAGLFLFIVGVKRTLQVEGRTVRADAPEGKLPKGEG